MTGERPRITIYTDGGADPNPGDGGWGAVLIEGKRTEQLCGGEPKTTNNRMEMTAAIEALSRLKTPHVVELHTDSQYLKNGITKWVHGWKRKGWKKSNGDPVLNEDLWRRLDELARQHEVHWHWVKGHAGDHYNEMADELATRGRQELRGARAGKKPKARPEALETEPEGKPSPEAAPSGETPNDGAAHVYLKVTASKSLAGWAAGIRGLPKSRVLADGQPGASANLLGILAVCAALDVIPKKQPVVVHVSSDYVRQGATEWLPGWQERNWRTKDKKPVANAEAWQALAERLKGRKVRFEKIQEADIPRRELLESLAKDAAKLRTKAGSG